MVAKTKEKEFTFTVVLMDGTSFVSEPMVEDKARSTAKDITRDGARNGDVYYPAHQIRRVKVHEHV